MSFVYSIFIFQTSEKKCINLKVQIVRIIQLKFSKKKKLNYTYTIYSCIQCKADWLE